MARAKTFADKAKGKVKSDTVTIKCVISVLDESSGTWKFRERIVRVKDPKEVETMKF